MARKKESKVLGSVLNEPHMRGVRTKFAMFDTTFCNRLEGDLVSGDFRLWFGIRRSKYLVMVRDLSLIHI